MVPVKIEHHTQVERGGEAMKGPGQGIELTPSQSVALDQIDGFLGNGPAQAFVLQGYAGTGKTFLIARLAQILTAQGREVHLLAPTGRAARVLRKATGLSAATLHSHLYRLDELEVQEARGPEESDRYRYRFALAPNNDSADAVYVVDEASMVPDTNSAGELLQFGSGRLLADLVEFVFGQAPSTSRRRLLFVGDPAQLPPVTDACSHALAPSHLEKTFNLQVAAAELVHVVRHREGSAILGLATSIRDSLRRGVFSEFTVEPAEGEIERCTAADVGAARIGHDADSIEPTEIFITHSNEAASRYNELCRARLFPGKGSIQPGDRILVVANCRRDGVQFFNGDFARIEEVDPELEMVEQPLARKRADGTREIVRLSFRRVALRVLDEQGRERRIGTRIIENLLDSRERDLTSLEMQALFLHFVFRHPRLRKTSPEFVRALQSDPWFNALRVKYAYAVTCHKAQGGEWRRAFVDMNTGLQPASAAFFRWAYTAITRAREQLVVIDPPRLSPDIPLRGETPGAVSLPAQLTVRSNLPRPGLRAEWLGDTRFQGLLAYQVFDEVSAAGARLLEAQHRPYQFSLTVEAAGQRARIQLFYNSGERVTRVIALPGSDRGLADPLLARLSLLQMRAFTAPAEPSSRVPEADNPPAVQSSVPFPTAAGHDAMARFDDSFRPRVLAAGLAIAEIDILGPFQIRYIFARNGGRASILYFFNGRGCCTTCSVDARRTTDPALSRAILDLSKGGGPGA